MSAIILPVTATTCGAPSGGPGTTSESHRPDVCWVFRAQWLHGITKPQGSGLGVEGTIGAGARPDGSPGGEGEGI